MSIAKVTKMIPLRLTRRPPVLKQKKKKQKKKKKKKALNEIFS